jgi:hypothetical protein
MKRVMPIRLMLALPLGLLLAACASHEATIPDAKREAANEQRVLDLERRVQRLEGRPPVEAPLRGPEEIQAHIKGLEAERAKLLVKYTDQHPAVRDIDRKLLILNEQLRKLEP